MIDDLGQSKPLIIDISDAFHQLPVCEEDTKNLSIVTPFCQYTYQIAPMAFCISPAYWQKFIKSVLQDVMEISIAVYNDGIITHACGSIEEQNALMGNVLV
jgi:hypothetical protein